MTDTALAILTPESLPAVFESGEKVDEVLRRIADAARSHVPDLTTVSGRKAIASNANKVARSKTALDDAGSSLVASRRAEIQAVDAERRRIRAFLDDLKAEVRAPLTEWEEAEEKRVNDLAMRMADFCIRSDGRSTTEELRSELARIEAIALDGSWQERAAEAGILKDKATAFLREELRRSEVRDAEVAELARLRAEATAREEAERAAAEAKRRADMEAAAEAERVARAAKIERDREEAAAKAAEAARVAAEREAQALIDAAQRAQREAEERARRAVEEERRRVEEERRREDAAEKRRAADAALRAKARREIASAITGKTPEQVADLLIAGRVPHTKVTL